MARPNKEKDQIRVPVSGSVLPDVAARVEVIAKREFRTKSQVIECLLLRGLAAHQRDGLLMEPPGESLVAWGVAGQDRAASLLEVSAETAADVRAKIDRAKDGA